jgi:hypothetical protein
MILHELSIILLDLRIFNLILHVKYLLTRKIIQFYKSTLDFNNNNLNSYEIRTHMAYRGGIKPAYLKSNPSRILIKSDENCSKHKGHGSSIQTRSDFVFSRWFLVT